MSKRNLRKKRVAEETIEENENEPKKKTLSSKVSQLKTEENLNIAKPYDNQENGINYWLMKSEPESRIENGHEMKFSFDDLKANKDQITWWDGVRNYEARNHMKQMKIGDRAFFYHSNCKNPGIIGIVKICNEAYIDHTAFDPKDAHFDPKSDKNNPKWFMVYIILN
jgi:predicted RNA-binding protein with PUA-like domain